MLKDNITPFHRGIGCLKRKHRGNERMEHQFPNINEMTTIEAISWYTKQVVEVTSVKNRVAGTYLDEYKQALLQCASRISSSPFIFLVNKKAGRHSLVRILSTS